MAKSKIKENHSLSVEGTLDITEGEEIKIEIEEIGVKTLSELLLRFNGLPITLSVKHATEINE